MSINPAPVRVTMVGEHVVRTDTQEHSIMCPCDALDGQ